MFESDDESANAQVQGPVGVPRRDKPVRALRNVARRAPKRKGVSSTGKPSVGSSPPETRASKQSTLPSEWTIDQVVDWLKSKGFSPDVYDKFIGQSISPIPLPIISRHRPRIYRA